MTAPVPLLQVREITPQQSGRHALQRVHQAGQRDLGRVVDKQADMVRLAVEFAPFGLEVGTHRAEDVLQPLQVLGAEHVATVLGDEDQVCMQGKNTVAASTNFRCVGAHRPSIIGALHRGHRARLYATPEQGTRLAGWAGCARLLWNIALDQRRWGRGHPIGKRSQCRELTALRAEFGWLAELPAQTAQQVFAELDLAFQRYWSGLAGYPQRKKKGRSSVVLRFPQGIEARRLNKRWGEVKLPKLGWVRFRWSRSLDGTLKHVTLTQKHGEWHVAFCLEQADVEPVPNGLPAVGIDRGVAIAFMTSDGEAIDQTRWKPTEKARLVALERRKARQTKGSNRYKRTCRAIGRLHRRAANRRRDFAHKTSTALAKNHGLVAVEALVLPTMTKSARGTVDVPGRNVRQKAGLNRAILDEGWGLVIEQLRYKCPQYGSVLIEVPARNTSLECAVCHHVSPDNRPLRAVFVCVQCGHADHADRNAALNIRERGIKLAQTDGQSGIGRRERKQLRTWRQPTLRAVA